MDSGSGQAGHGRTDQGRIGHPHRLEMHASAAEYISKVPLGLRLEASCLVICGSVDVYTHRADRGAPGTGFEHGGRDVDSVIAKGK